MVKHITNTGDYYNHIKPYETFFQGGSNLLQGLKWLTESVSRCLQSLQERFSKVTSQKQAIKKLALSIQSGNFWLQNHVITVAIRSHCYCYQLQMTMPRVVNEWTLGPLLLLPQKNPHPDHYACQQKPRK